MSLRTFTVFQDAPSSEAPQPKISRPNVMVTRSQRLASINGTAEGSSATASSDLAVVNKENYNPVTGERAGPSTSSTKKRKTTVLATKVQPPLATKSKKYKDAQPELEPEPKKRKASTSSTSKVKTKKVAKGSGSVKKGGSKRAGSRRVSPMPRLNEEDESEKERIAQADIDSRCYELTVKPLADISQAYEEVDVFEGPLNACAPSTTFDDKVKFSTVKETSVEPELRDYFQPPQAPCSSSSSRLLRALSEDAPEPRAFSTPERKQIYAAFTFSSPSTTTTRLSKASRSGSISPAELL
ncbi:hypothetical protein BDZ97DRAFT_1917427 [Flammula alnicola]|nr:hypothetical protein BDZ97DRAFT_1917427 [Flammula alnicola]